MHLFPPPSCPKGTLGLCEVSQDTWKMQLAPSPAKVSTTAVGVAIGPEHLTPLSFHLKTIHGQEPVSTLPQLPWGLPGGQKVLQDYRKAG